MTFCHKKTDLQPKKESKKPFYSRKHQFQHLKVNGTIFEYV